MTASPSTYLVARAYVAQLGILNSNFYNMGQSTVPNAVSSGTTINSYVIPGFVSYAPAAPTYEDVVSYASEQVRGRREVGVTDYGIGQLVLSEYDEKFNQLIGGATPSTTIASGVVVTSPNALQKSPPRVVLTLTAAATPVTSAENFVNISVLNCTIRRARVGTNQGNGKNPNNLTYDLVVSAGNRAPWGSLLSALAMGLTNSSDTELELSAPAIYITTTYVDDGSATTITLPYTPFTTEHAGVFNMFTKNGVDSHASVSGISGSTVTITPGSAGDIWNLNILYAYKDILFA